MTPRKETPIATRQAVINMRENGMRGTEIAMIMTDTAERLAKIGREEYDLILRHDAPDADEKTKFECDLRLARFRVLRSQLALKNVYNEEDVTPAKLYYLKTDLESAQQYLKELESSPAYRPMIQC